MARTITSPASDQDCREYNVVDSHLAAWVFGAFTYTYRVRDRDGSSSSKPARSSFRRGGE